MYHITIKPDNFEFSNDLVSQTPYGIKNTYIDNTSADKQHHQIINKLKNNVLFTINKTSDFIPDLVFISSAGLSLPRLPESVVILPNMKYEQRRRELKYIKEIFTELKIKTVEFPTENRFEGQAEAKWFNNGELLIVGYGFRSSRGSIKILKKLINEIYNSYGIVPPRVLPLHLISFRFYHLDLALLELSQSSCILHESAIKEKDKKRLQKELDVTIISTEDSFCLNSVIEGDNILTHILNDNALKGFLEEKTGKKVIELDTSEFEKSGGSVRCLIFDIYDPRLFKRKKNSHSNPSSPKL